jgi:hypothetical protein
MTQALSKDFQAAAIARLKSGESLTGKDRILTRLIKQIILEIDQVQINDKVIAEIKNGKLLCQVEHKLPNS